MTFVVAIGGGTGSGKTTAAHLIETMLGKTRVKTIAFDDYYRDQPTKSLEERKKTNYDHPDALDAGLLVRHLNELKRGNPIKKPVYNFVTHSRMTETETVGPKPVILVEGILVLGYTKLLRCFDLTIYLDEPADIRFIRRLRRDTQERGRSMESVIDQYLATVRPMHELYVEPTKALADHVVAGEENEVWLREIVEREIQPRLG